MRARRFKAPLPQSMPRFVVVEKGRELSRSSSAIWRIAGGEHQGTAQALELLRRVSASAILVDGFSTATCPRWKKGWRGFRALPVVTCWLAGDDLAARELGVARYLPSR